MTKDTSKRDTQGALLLLLLGIVLALAMGELLVRALPATLLGFSFEAGGFTTPKEFARDDTVNSLGFHDAPLPDREPGITRVLLLGDSYVAADSVLVHETVGQRLEYHLNASSKRRFQVISAGKNGVGQRWELGTLKRLGPELQPDLVLCLFLTLNDVRNNLPRLHERARKEGRQKDRVRPRWIYLKHEDARFLFFEWSTLNQLVSYWATRYLSDRPLPETPLDYLVYASETAPDWEDAWRGTEELLLKMAAVSKTRGARFGIISASTPQGVLGAEEGLADLLVTYPEMREGDWDMDGPDRRLSDICESNGIPLLLLEPIFRRRTREGEGPLHWRYDGHWNPRGNDAAAAEIARFVLRKFPNEE